MKTLTMEVWIFMSTNGDIPTMHVSKASYPTLAAAVDFIAETSMRGENFRVVSGFSVMYNQISNP